MTGYPFDAVAVMKYKPPPGSAGISFVKGEKIHVVEAADEDEDWFKGQNAAGIEGVFPATFVERVGEEEDPKEPNQTSIPSEGEGGPVVSPLPGQVGGGSIVYLPDKHTGDESGETPKLPSGTLPAQHSVVQLPVFENGEIKSAPNVPTPTALKRGSHDEIAAALNVSGSGNTPLASNPAKEIPSAGDFQKGADSPDPATPKKPQSLKDRIAALNAMGAGAGGPGKQPPIPRPKPAFKPKAIPTTSAATLPTSSSSDAQASQASNSPLTTASDSRAPADTPGSGSRGVAMSAEDAQASIGQGGGSLKERMARLQGLQLDAPSMPGRAPKPWRKKSENVDAASPTAVSAENQPTGEADHVKPATDDKMTEEPTGIESEAGSIPSEESELNMRNLSAPHRSVEVPENSEQNTTAAEPAAEPYARDGLLPPMSDRSSPALTPIAITPLPKRAGPPRRAPRAGSSQSSDTVKSDSTHAPSEGPDKEVSSIALGAAILPVSAAAVSSAVKSDGAPSLPDVSSDKEGLSPSSAVQAAESQNVIDAKLVPSSAISLPLQEKPDAESAVLEHKDKEEDPADGDERMAGDLVDDESEVTGSVPEPVAIAAAPPPKPSGRPPLPPSFATREATPLPTSSKDAVGQEVGAHEGVEEEEEEEGEQEEAFEKIPSKGVAVVADPTTKMTTSAPSGVPIGRPAIPDIPSSFEQTPTNKRTSLREAVPVVIPTSLQDLVGTGDRGEDGEATQAASSDGAAESADKQESTTFSRPSTRSAAPPSHPHTFVAGGSDRAIGEPAKQQIEEGGTPEEPHGEEAGEGGEHEDDEEEEEEEEDPEVARRRALAARMAKLGGMNMRMGPMMPPIGGAGGLRKKKVVASPSNESTVDAKEESVPSAPQFRLPGAVPAGGVLMPGIMPRSAPAPSSTANDSSEVGHSSQKSEPEGGVAGDVKDENDDDEENAPPSLSKGRPSTLQGPPQRELPQLTRDDTDLKSLPSVSSSKEPISTHTAREADVDPGVADEEILNGQQQEHGSMEINDEEEEIGDSGDILPPLPPQRSVHSSPPMSTAAGGVFMAQPASPAPARSIPSVPGHTSNVQNTAATSRSSVDLHRRDSRGSTYDNSSNRSPVTRQSSIMSNSSKRASVVGGEEMAERERQQGYSASASAPVPEMTTPGLHLNSVQLSTLSSTLGAQIFAAAHSVKNNKSANSNWTTESFLAMCWSRAPDALPPSTSNHSHGLPIYGFRIPTESSSSSPSGSKSGGSGGMGSNGRAVATYFSDEPRSGDILLLAETKFKQNLSTKRVGTVGKPHLAVVEGWDASKRKMKVIEVGSGGKVEEGSYKVDDLRAGEMVVFRVLSIQLLQQQQQQ